MQPERTVSRFTFRLTVLLAVFLIIVFEIIVLTIISRRLGSGKDSPIGGYVGGLVMLNIFLAYAGVDRAFKAFGLSRSGRMVEGRRPAAMASESTSVEDVVDIQCSRSVSNALVLMCLVPFALIFLAVEVLAPKHGTGREVLPLLYAIFLGSAAYMYLMRYITIIRIDAQGVTAHRKPYSIRRTTIPWSRIASCDLVVTRNTFGEIALAYPVMKGVDGKDLFVGLAQAMAMAIPEDQLKVLRSLKGRFPKLDLDPWEL